VIPYLGPRLLLGISVLYKMTHCRLNNSVSNQRPLQPFTYDLSPRPATTSRVFLLISYACLLFLFAEITAYYSLCVAFLNALCDRCNLLKIWQRASYFELGSSVTSFPSFVSLSGFQLIKALRKKFSDLLLNPRTVSVSAYLTVRTRLTRKYILAPLGQLIAAVL